MATTEVSGKAAPANFKSNSMSEKEDEYILEWVVTSTSLVTEFNVEYSRDDASENEWIPVASNVNKVGDASYAGKVSLHNLLPATKYAVRVAAKNSYGYSSFSPNFVFSTFNEKLLQQQQQQKEDEAHTEPKHQKSVSGSEIHSLSHLLVLLITGLLLTR